MLRWGRLLLYFLPAFLLLGIEAYHPGAFTTPRWFAAIAVALFVVGTVAATFREISDPVRHPEVLIAYALANAWLIVYFARVYVVAGLVNCSTNGDALYFSIAKLFDRRG